jgi:hypothetical protein
VPFSSGICSQVFGSKADHGTDFIAAFILKRRFGGGSPKFSGKP